MFLSYLRCCRFEYATVIVPLQHGKHERFKDRLVDTNARIVQFRTTGSRDGIIVLNITQRHDRERSLASVQLVNEDHYQTLASVDQCMQTLCITTAAPCTQHLSIYMISIATSISELRQKRSVCGPDLINVWTSQSNSINRHWATLVFRLFRVVSRLRARERTRHANSKLLIKTPHTTS